MAASPVCVPYEQCLTGETVQANAVGKAQEAFDDMEEPARIRFPQQIVMDTLGQEHIGCVVSDGRLKAGDAWPIGPLGQHTRISP